jgi:hypothetical protein
MKTQFTFDLKTIIIVAVVIIALFSGGFGFMGLQFKKTNDKLAEQVNLSNALKDELRYTKNYLEEEVATKLTLQTTIKKLEDLNGELTDNQKELVSRIKSLEKDNNLISAALVRTEAKLDSALFDDGEVEIGDDYVSYAKATDSIVFNVTMNNVQPLVPYKEPTLMFNELIIPNKQEITFSFKDDKKYYQKPISFSISNSNPLVTTTEADSYTIPEINYKVLHPTFGEKVGEFFNKPAVKIIGGAVLLGGGIYIGATAF